MISVYLLLDYSPGLEITFRKAHSRRLYMLMILILI